MVTASQKAEQRFDAALEALAEQHAPGPLNRRVESAIDEVLDEVLDAFADVLGGGMSRSKGIRTALEKGFMAMRDERRARV